MEKWCQIPFILTKIGDNSKNKPNLTKNNKNKNEIIKNI